MKSHEECWTDWRNLIMIQGVVDSRTKYSKIEVSYKSIWLIGGMGSSAVWAIEASNVV